MKELKALNKIDVPASWKDAKDEEKEEQTELPDFIENILIPVNAQEGDSLPVSTFVGAEDGTLPQGSSKYEKRGIAITVPCWHKDNCIQCNQCSYVCPHAAIRPILLDEEEEKNAPASFETKPAIGKDVKGLSYRLQVSPLDCTGCGNCVDICPAKKRRYYNGRPRQPNRRERQLGICHDGI